jgi:hypothetical protein
MATSAAAAPFDIIRRIGLSPLLVRQQAAETLPEQGEITHVRRKATRRPRRTRSQKNFVTFVTFVLSLRRY